MSNKQVTFDGDALASSRYFERFKKLQEIGDLMTLKGDMILVERLPKVEKTLKVGGVDLVIGEAKTYKETMHDASAEFGIVLMVGPGQILDDGSLLPCDAKPGDVVLLSGNIYWYSQFGHMADYDPYTIGRLRDSQVALWFSNYKKAFEVLNG